MNIRLLSEKLARANQAFNTVLFPKKYSGSEELGPGEEEAKDLHTIFSTRGEDLELNYLGEDKCEDDVYMYHCRIEPKVFNGISVRLIYLQSQRMEMSINTQHNISSGKLQTDHESTLQVNIEDVSEESVPSERMIRSNPDKKDDLMLKKMKRNKVSEPQYIELETPSTNKRDYVLTTTEQGGYMTTSRKLLTTKEANLEHTPRFVPPLESIDSPEFRNRGNQNRHKQTHVSQHTKPFSENQSSQAAGQRNANQLSKDFEGALKSKYYPNYFRFLILLFYLAIICIIGGQVYTNQEFKRQIKLLEARKNVARAGFFRTEYMTQVYGQIRKLWIYATGLQNQSDYPVSFRAPGLIQRFRGTLNSLAQANDNMLVTINSLDPQDQYVLFQKNVRIFDSKINGTRKTHITLDTFQTVQLIVETGFRALAFTNISLEAAIPDFNIILLNTPSDFLAATLIISNFLIQPVDSLKATIIQRNNGNLAFNLSFLVLLFVIFCFIVLKQYKQQRRNMIALTKLNMLEVTKLIEKVTIFQTMLQDETDFEKLENVDVYESSKARRDRLHYIETKGAYTKASSFQMRYWLYPAKLLALLAIIGACVIVKYYITDNSTNNLSYLMNQIYFTDRMRPRLRISVDLTQDLVSDNTSIIRTHSAIDEYTSLISYFQTALSAIPDQLKARDNTYDPMIQQILFGDACAYVTNYLSPFCLALRQNYTNDGLIRFLTAYEAAYEDFLDQYQESNKTVEVLAALSLNTYNNIAPPILIIVDLLNTTSSRLDATFGDTMTQSNVASDISNILLILCFIIICVLIHLYVINRLRETENEFRNILKVFPAKLVLANFMLKSYFLKTWKEIPNASRMLNGD